MHASDTEAEIQATEEDLCIHCSFAKAQRCRSASVSQVAAMGNDKIYQYDPCGISFCVRSSNDDQSSVEVIACMDMD